MLQNHFSKDALCREAHLLQQVGIAWVLAQTRQQWRDLYCEQAAIVLLIGSLQPLECLVGLPTIGVRFGYLKSTFVPIGWDKQFVQGGVMIQEGNLLVVAPNITPDVETGAGSWTDDQFARAIREGIGHDGRTLFPLMPYGSFRNLSDEDLASIIVYVRSLPPVRKTLPKRHIPFLLSRLINTAPEPVKKPVVVSDSDATSHGRYLTRIAECMACHTPTDDMRRPLPGMEFSGGRVFESFHVASANITPDASGISYYDENLFIRTLRTGSVGARPLHFPMPWWNFRRMTDEDLKAIFAYLRTVKPVHHRIDNSEEATVCKVCNGRHGGGIENDRDRSLAETQRPTGNVDRLNRR